MKFIPRKLYAKIEKKLFDRFWENELLNFLKLKFFFFKFKIEKKINKRPMGLGRSTEFLFHWSEA